MSIETVWSRAVPSTLGTQQTLTLPADELLLILCIHAHKHEWQRLKWIADIARLIEARPHVDWTSLARRAADMDQSRAVLLGFFLAASLLRASPPEQIRRLVARGSLSAQAGLIRGRLFRSEHSLPGFSEWLAYVEALRSTPGTEAALQRWNRWRYLLAVTVPESEEQFEFQVPRSLSFLHYVNRPLRLFRRHGFALVQRLR
jgi:hypothetical protein